MKKSDYPPSPVMTRLHNEMTREEAEEAYEGNQRSLFNPGMNGGLTVIIDVTGSMSGVIASLTKSLIRYTDVMFKGQVARMTLVCMDDHYEKLTKEEQERIAKEGGSPAVLFADTTDDQKTFTKWLREYPHGNGGDAPEAWACAIHEARLRDPEANIWLVTDAPPHGGKYQIEGGDTWGGGCPCGIDLDLTGVNVLRFRLPMWQPGDTTSRFEEGYRYFERLWKCNPDSLTPFSQAALDDAFQKYLGGS